ncbi:MAG: hypothetical protein NC926_09185 [Candidatus Omnitrophica bacterium]|nr:hypothetical protein [Candidatus Omnitrophota bacterium]
MVEVRLVEFYYDERDRMFYGEGYLDFSDEYRKILRENFDVGLIKHIDYFYREFVGIDFEGINFRFKQGYDGEFTTDLIVDVYIRSFDKFDVEDYFEEAIEHDKSLLEEYGVAGIEIIKENVRNVYDMIVERIYSYLEEYLKDVINEAKREWQL